MKLSMMSPLTGKTNTMELPITEERLNNWKRDRKTNRTLLIQDAFPDLNHEQREFIMTGYTPEDWDEIFGELEEDEFE